MIEPVMYIGIGFLIAGLLVIGVIPLVHARAVRLTMRRLEALTPISRAEIQADKDQLRAEFAMAMSRLEMNVEQMKAKATSQAADIGRKSDAIGRLKFELGEKTAALLALEAKEKQLADEVHALENELAARTGVLQETEGALASTRAELARIAANFKQSSLSSDSQRAELAAAQAQAALLHDHVGGYDKENKELRERLSNKTAEVEAVRQQLTAERGRAEQLGVRAGELERQLIAQTAQADALGRRVQEFGTQLEEQARFLTDYENASDRLRNEAMSARERSPSPCDRYRDHREVVDRKRAQAVPGRTRQAAARDRGDEARRGERRRQRAQGKRGAARKHQRRCGRGRPAHRYAGRA